MSQPERHRARAIADGEGRLRIEGVLDFDSVVPLLAQGERLMPRAGQVRIDLSGVESANSAGLALLLEWLDLACSRQLDLRYLAVPESLTRIAALSNLPGDWLETGGDRSGPHGPPS